ncbi:MAG: hypothetical protein LBI56_00580 [Puniceicoccales bacterium]|jgi:hypothetical protein|nr:hypothetical protein [Puniceicoccales bacterium]
MDIGKKERTTLVEMEKKLLGDKSGTYRRELVNQLLQYESEINVLVHNANDNGELFELLNKVKTAIQSAKHTIEKF